MTKLPLVLAVLLCAIMAVISIPFLLIIYLLGGYNVVDNYIDMLSYICFNK